MDKRALIITDIQNDFTEGGELAVAGGAHVASRTRQYCAIHGGEYTVIVATKCWHPVPRKPDNEEGWVGQDYIHEGFPHFSANPDFVDTWPVHCVQGTYGAQFHPSLQAEDGFIDRVFYKGQDSAAYSGFEGVISLRDGVPAILDENWAIDGIETGGLDWYLRYWGITHLDVVGIATDYCVKATAIDGIRAGYFTKVLVNLTAAVDGTTAKESLAEMAATGVEVFVG